MQYIETAYSLVSSNTQFSIASVTKEVQGHYVESPMSSKGLTIDMYFHLVQSSSSKKL